MMSLAIRYEIGGSPVLSRAECRLERLTPRCKVEVRQAPHTAQITATNPAKNHNTSPSKVIQPVSTVGRRGWAGMSTNPSHPNSTALVQLFVQYL